MFELLKEMLKKELEEAVIKYEELNKEIARLENKINEYDKNYKLLQDKEIEYGTIILRNPDSLGIFNRIFHKKEYEKEKQAYIDHELEKDKLKKKLDKLEATIDEERPKIEAKIQEIIKQIELEHLKEANNKRKSIDQAKNLRDLGLTIQDVVRIFKENNTPLILTNTDPIVENESEFDKVDDYILVHKTKYVPTDNEIKNLTNSNVKATTQVNTGITTINVDFLNKRDTVHFAVNGEVSSNVATSVFEGRKYAVLIPIKDVKNITNFVVQDTFTDGNVNIEKGIILCPENEIKETQEKNPNTIVIGYKDSQTVDGYANKILSIMGYKYEKVQDHSWENSEDATKAEENINKFITTRTQEAHAVGNFRIKELMDTSNSFLVELLRKIKNENIAFDTEFLTSSLAGINNELDYNLQINPKIYNFDGLYENEREQAYRELKEDLYDIGIEIPYYVDYLIKCSKESSKSFEQAYMNLENKELYNYLQKHEQYRREHGDPPLSADKIIIVSIAFSILKQIELQKEKEMNK